MDTADVMDRDDDATFQQHCGDVMRFDDNGREIRRLCGVCARVYSETLTQPDGCGAVLL